jgi:hypothetical protein
LGFLEPMLVEENQIGIYHRLGNFMKWQERFTESI